MLFLIFSFLFSFVFAQENFSFHEDPDTAAFKKVYKEIEAGRAGLSKEILSKYQILFIQGLSTDITHKFGKIIGPVISEQPGFLSSFYQQKQFLNNQGIFSSFIPINPNESCEKNGEVITAHIHKQFLVHNKKIILITQSKAGPDVLHGLVKKPEVIGKIAGWIAFQPPHSGTYLAEAPTNGPVRMSLIGLLYRTLKGSGLAITEMRRDFRKTFMQRNEKVISKLVAKIPVITLVTDELPLKHPQTGSFLDYLAIPFRGQNQHISFLSPFVGPIKNNGGGLNDGIAMVRGTCLKKTRTCIYLHGIDHFAAVMNTSPYKTLSQDERILIFQGLLMTLSKQLHPDLLP